MPWCQAQCLPHIPPVGWPGQNPITLWQMTENGAMHALLETALILGECGVGKPLALCSTFVPVGHCGHPERMPSKSIGQPEPLGKYRFNGFNLLTWVCKACAIALSSLSKPIGNFREGIFQQSKGGRMLPISPGYIWWSPGLIQPYVFHTRGNTGYIFIFKI